jgi:hypothetical protein
MCGKMQIGRLPNVVLLEVLKLEVFVAQEGFAEPPRSSECVYAKKEGR